MLPAAFTPHTLHKNLAKTGEYRFPKTASNLLKMQFALPVGS